MTDNYIEHQLSTLPMARRKSKGGIWVTNKYKKKRSHHDFIKPLTKKCTYEGCERRIKNHHYYCQEHWNLTHGKNIQ